MNLDFREGCPKKYNKKQIEHAVIMLKTHSYRKVEEITWISISTLKRAKKAREEEKEMKKMKF
ncbi:resolvase [Bacillus cereus]|nr:resolvase [Bacillus cereus]